MQTLTEKAYRLPPPGGLFDETVVRNLFPGRTEGARRALVHRAVRSGEVLRLRPGLYCLDEVFRRTHPHPFAVAAMLHYPSHVSLESALWHHGLIPEAVVETASVTAFRARRFDTPLGRFTFTRVSAWDPRAGVEAVELAPDTWAFVASPLRAIADLVYLRREVTWEADGVGLLTESLRIEPEDLDGMATEDAEETAAAIRDRRTRAYLAGLLQELGR